MISNNLGFLSIWGVEHTNHFKLKEIIQKRTVMTALNMGNTNMKQLLVYVCNHYHYYIFGDVGEWVTLARNFATYRQ